MIQVQSDPATHHLSCSQEDVIEAETIDQEDPDSQPGPRPLPAISLPDYRSGAPEVQSGPRLATGDLDYS